MKCPKCDSDFQRINFRDIEVDRCSVCQGIWFDAAEEDELKGMTSSDVLDSGDETLGQMMDDIRKIDCPNCHIQMIPRVDREQQHIRYEFCKKCLGAFFDAGEFKDWREITLEEWLRAHQRH